MIDPTSPLPPKPLPVQEKTQDMSCDTHVHLLASPAEFALFDWPHIMLNGAQMPQGADLWHAFLRAVPDPATRHQILVENPALLYRFDA